MKSNDAGRQYIVLQEQVIVLEKISRFIIQNNVTLMQEDHAIRKWQQVFQAVFDDNNGIVLFFLDPGQDIEDLAPTNRIKHGGGFVEDHYFGHHGQDGRQRHALFLSPRNLIRWFVDQGF